MNLTFAPSGVPMKILKVKLKGDQGKQLSNMGFVEGASIMVVSENNGNIIVNIKGSRVGIGKDISQKISVIPE